jgi:hypothetical protein
VQAYRQWVDVVHLGYDVDDLGSATLPAYNGSLSMQHATIDTVGPGSSSRSGTSSKAPATSD